MKTRLAKKLWKEMYRWKSADAVVRHSSVQFKKSWERWLRCVKLGHKDWSKSV